MKWHDLALLEGKVLRTLDQKKPFDVVKLEKTLLVVRPHENGIERNIKRSEIEGAYEELCNLGEISRQDIRKRHSNFNPAYVAAILAELPHVTHQTRPIRLKFTKG